MPLPEAHVFVQAIDAIKAAAGNLEAIGVVLLGFGAWAWFRHKGWLP